MPAVWLQAAAAVMNSSKHSWCQAIAADAKMQGRIILLYDKSYGIYVSYVLEFVCSKICISLDITDSVEDITFLYIDLSFSLIGFCMSLTGSLQFVPSQKIQAMNIFVLQ